MKLDGLVALAAVAVLASACAPSTSQSRGTGDEKTGTLKVWLYDEAKRTPKEKVVADAVAEFTAAHKGVTVEVTYIPTDAGPRAEKMKGAFNDQASAPDVVEFGNTDLAGYVAAGGLADITSDLSGWKEMLDLPADLKDAATVNGKMRGLPWWLGVRALYYRTDTFTELNLKPPTSYAELVAAAKKVRANRADMMGIAVGGKYVFGALPFVWDAGGDIATKSGDKYAPAINTPQSRAGVKAYTDLFAADICPAQLCADLTGGKTVEAFAAGKAAMAILPNSSRGSVDAGVAKGRYAVVPLPGSKPGSVAPAFAGGQDLGVMASTRHRTLAVQLLQLLGGRKYQLAMYDAMGNLPAFASARTEAVSKEPFLRPFVDTIAAGTRFVPVDAAWTKIDSQAVVPTMLQEIITSKATVDAATDKAATAIDAALSGK